MFSMKRTLQHESASNLSLLKTIMPDLQNTINLTLVTKLIQNRQFNKG